MSESTNADENAGGQSSIYEQLHRLAEGALRRETPGHSLQPTLLVNDAYLKLLEQKNIDPADRSQVMAAGATIIRRLLVDYARTRKAQKRGGSDGRGIPLHISVADSASQLDVLELNDALEALGAETFTCGPSRRAEVLRRTVRRRDRGTTWCFASHREQRLAICQSVALSNVEYRSGKPTQR